MEPSTLACNICPKQPTFSDVSHLLTHVSSKGHLSHYFKLQVRSHQEPGAGELLSQYDRWYKANNLAKLLSDRLSSKEIRKQKTHDRVKAQGARCTARKDPTRQGTKKAAEVSPDITVETCIDPRLSNSRFRYELPEVSVESSQLAIEASRALAKADSECTASCQPEYPEPPDTDFHDPHFQGQKRVREAEPGDAAPSDMPSTPIRPAKRNAITRSSEQEFDPFIDASGNVSSIDIDVADKERADEIARLKGVLWPGMDIFDAATEQMRRKRNQRKDDSMLKMMEKTSLDTQPTEMVFSPTGILRKERFISGEVDDNSPLKGETPIPKTRPIRPRRAALSRADPNILLQRRKGRKRAKNETHRHVDGASEPNEMEDQPNEPESPEYVPTSYQNGFYAALQPSLADEDDDWKLAVNTASRKSHRKLAVFHDHQTSGSLLSQDHCMRPGLGWGTQIHQPPFPLHRSLSENSSRLYESGSHFLGSDKPITGRQDDKENLEPYPPKNRRGERYEGWRPPFSRPQLPNSGYLLQGPFARISGGHAEDMEDLHAFGITRNPLTASLAHLSSRHHDTYTQGESSDQEKKPSEEAASPDRTISDVEEEDDFERLYLDGSVY